MSLPRELIALIRGVYTKADTDTKLGAKADLISGKVPASQLPAIAQDADGITETASRVFISPSEKTEITTLRTDVNLKASLAAPTFTGIPRAPTPATNNDTTQLATTAYVRANLATKANNASPALTGTPTAPTAAVGTNTQQLATSAFIISEFAARRGAANGLASLGADNKVPSEQLPTIPSTTDNLAETTTRVFITPAQKTEITTLRTDLGTKADLVGGKVPESQLPASGGLDAAAVQALIDGSRVGDIVMLPAGVLPSGRRILKLNGAAVSRTTYAALWTYAQASGNLAASQGAKALGQFGPGDGSTTFTLPDMRGQFMRAWDDGKGTDASRAIGSSQLSANLSHSHGGSAAAAGAHTPTGSTASAGDHTHNGYTDSAGNHNHTVSGGQTGFAPYGGGTGFQPAAMALSNANINIDYAGSHSHNVYTYSGGSHTHSLSMNAVADHTHTLTITAVGDTESRPINVAALFGIYY